MRSTPSALLKRLNELKRQAVAVISTICRSFQCFRSSAKVASETPWGFRVSSSPYVIAARSAGVKSASPVSSRQLTWASVTPNRRASPVWEPSQ